MAPYDNHIQGAKGSDNAIESMTPDERKQKYIKRLGTEFGNMFFAVEEEWCRVLSLCQECMELFGDSDRVTLLNTLGRGIGYIEGYMSDALILGLCRLTDNNSRSASVCNLPKLIYDNFELREKVQEYADKANRYAEAARERRNKWIAHSDIDRELIKVTYKEIKSGVDSVHEAINAIFEEYWESTSLNIFIHYNASPLGELSNRIESLIKGILFIDSLIDPTGDTNPYNNEVNKTFLNKIRGDSVTSQDEVKIRDLRMSAKIIKERLGKNYE
ncbi:MAG: hypothetical protein OXG88_09305 [Gammaproteobacteria bacterium]|nr:hypothetical protein [Gammaproteobacteria bacterium]